MSRSPYAPVRAAFALSIALIGPLVLAQMKPEATTALPPPASPTCENVPHSDHPHYHLSERLRPGARLALDRLFLMALSKGGLKQ